MGLRLIRLAGHGCAHLDAPNPWLVLDTALEADTPLAAIARGRAWAGEALRQLESERPTTDYEALDREWRSCIWVLLGAREALIAGPTPRRSTPPPCAPH